MGTESSGNDGLTLFGLAIGGMYLFRVYREIRTRVVQPGAQDSARTLKRLLIWGLPLLALGGIVANVVAFRVFGADAVIPAILLDVVGFVGLIWLAALLWDAAEVRRRATGYVISEFSYVAAPRPVKSAMWRIHKSARAVRGGRAHQDGMFGALELDQVVYEAAQQAVVSADLSSAANDLKAAATADDANALKAATEQLDEILLYLQALEASLKRAASAATKLSEDIARPEKAQAASKLAADAAAAKAKRREQARARLDEVAIRAAARPTTNSGDIEDRVTAVRDGYTEAASVSDAVLKGRSARPPEEQIESHQGESEETRRRRRAAREAVWKATKVSAEKAGKLSATAAKAGSEKLRNLSKDD